MVVRNSEASVLDALDSPSSPVLFVERARIDERQASGERGNREQFGTEKLLLLRQMDLVHAICASTGFRRPPAHRSRFHRSIARTVLAARPNRSATCRPAALSHA